MNKTTVVTFTDFSAPSEIAVQRAALMARPFGATLQLVYREAGAGARLADRLARLSMRSTQLARRWDIEVRNPSGRPESVQSLLAACTPGTMVVVDPATARSLRIGRGWLGGHSLIDDATCPVMLVQRDCARAYETVLVAYDTPAEARRLGAVAVAWTQAAMLDMFRVPPPPARSSRADAAQQGQERPPPWPSAPGVPRVRHSDHLSSRRNRFLHRGGTADPVRPLAHHAEFGDADLVVVTGRPRSLVDRMLGRSFQQRLARVLACDLLVYPQLRSAAEAYTRLKSSWLGSRA